MTITIHDVRDTISNIIQEDTGEKPFLVPSARLFEHLQLHESLGRGYALNVIAEATKKLGLDEKRVKGYLGEIHESPSGKTPCTSQDYTFGEIGESMVRASRETA